MISLGAYEYNTNLSELLGSGAFSFVYKGRLKSRQDEEVAIKIMKKEANMPKNRALLNKEISVLKVTLSEETIRHILVQIGSAMDAINRRGFMHRDIKPGNILLSHCRDCGQLVTKIPGYLLTFKLADFGFARFLQDGMMAVTMCGSPMYMAPEVLMCRRYDAVADIWSMGVIVYQCMTGKAPFYANNPEALKNLYERSVNLRPKIPVTTSRLLRDLLLRMLVRNPVDRIDFDSFLNHPFLHQRHFEPPTNSSGSKNTTVTGTVPSRIKREPLTTDQKAPIIGALGHGTGDGPFYLDGRNNTLTNNDNNKYQRDSSTGSAQRNRASPGIGLNANPTQQPGSFARVAPLPASAAASSKSPPHAYALNPTLEDLDDEMSRTTVDDYFEDELDTSMLPFEATPMPRYASPASTNTPMRAEPFRVGAPPVPCRGSSTVGWRPSAHTPPSRPSGSYGGRAMPSGLEPTETHLDEYVIVNRDGSEAERFARGQFQPNAELANYPMSNIGRIVTNPTAYLAAHTGGLAAGTLPDVAAVHPGSAGTGPSPYPTTTNITSSPRSNNQTPPTRPAPRLSTASPTPAVRQSPATQPHSYCPHPTMINSGDFQAGTEHVRLRPHSGGGILDYGGNMTHGGGLWQAAEFSDEQIMDPEHNEEIKTITMVLELCELLGELAERRASVLTDCTVTTSTAPAHDASSSADLTSEGAADRRSTTTVSTDDAESRASRSTPTTGLKFLSEAQRIVEQIVLYRRILYYLEYVFVQVKKAFHLRRLKSTATSRRRLSDCNALYHRCYIRLCQLVRQSRRDDLIEPVGRLLANITANRLIFQYAMIQCQAAEVDEYVGEIAQSVLRYKAGITLIHGLCQHAKSDNDKRLLAECRRLLNERYIALRAAAAAKTTHGNAAAAYYPRTSAAFAGVVCSSPVGSDRSPTPQATTQDRMHSDVAVAACD